jgi:hypothetical protein
MSFFFLLENRRGNRFCLGILVPVGGGKNWRKGLEGEYGANNVYTCM